MNEKDQHVKLKRQLGLFDSSMMVIGIVIGSGIFMTTVLKADGHLPAFLFGWVAFSAYVTGTNAAIAVAIAEHLGSFYPSLSTHSILVNIGNFGLSVGQLVAVSLLVVLSVVNYLGVILGKWVQNIFTVLKIGSILLFALAGIFISTGNQINFSLNPTGMGFGSIITGIGIALVAVNWTVGGWEYVTFTAGEIKNPKRNLPLALFIGTLVILVLYLLINITYLKALPMNALAGEIKVGEATAKALYGQNIAGLFIIVVIISMFGALNGNILVGARVTYAMAKDNLFFPSAAKVHPKNHTPGNAIIIQGVWSSILALSGTFEELITLVVFVNFMMWITAASTVFVLRKKQPDLDRPYKVWGYPYIPAFFILISTAIMINIFFTAPAQSFLGIGLTLTGIPAYLFWGKNNTY